MRDHPSSDSKSSAPRISTSLLVAGIFLFVGAVALFCGVTLINARLNSPPSTPSTLLPTATPSILPPTPTFDVFGVRHPEDPPCIITGECGTGDHGVGNPVSGSLHANCRAQQGEVDPVCELVEIADAELALYENREFKMVSEAGDFLQNGSVQLIAPERMTLDDNGVIRVEVRLDEETLEVAGLQAGAPAARVIATPVLGTPRPTLTPQPIWTTEFIFVREFMGADLVGEDVGNFIIDDRQEDTEGIIHIRPGRSSGWQWNIRPRGIETIGLNDLTIEIYLPLVRDDGTRFTDVTNTIPFQIEVEGGPAATPESVTPEPPTPVPTPVSTATSEPLTDVMSGILEEIPGIVAAVVVAVVVGILGAVGSLIWKNITDRSKDKDDEEPDDDKIDIIVQIGRDVHGDVTIAEGYDENGDEG